MNRILTIFLAMFCTYSYSQDDLLIDMPIKKLNDGKDRYNVTLELDSLGNICRTVDVTYIDAVDFLRPAQYTVYMNHCFPVKYHLLATWKCGDSSVYLSSYTIPMHCLFWSKPDSNTLYTTSDTKHNHYRTMEYRPDSILQTDMNCLAEFYQSKSDSVRCDTLLIKNGTRFDWQSFKSLPYWECAYYYEQKHGKEVARYHIEEVYGICVNANTNLKKYEGEWKYGEKKGKWYFYNIYGDLLRIEYYRKGVCKKVKNITNT